MNVATPNSGFAKAVRVASKARLKKPGPIAIDAKARSASIAARTRQGGEPAARLTDKIKHSSALTGFLVGCVMGAIAAAVVFSTIATGGAALFVLGAVAAAGAGMACEEIGKKIGAAIPGPVTGMLITGANNLSSRHVKVNGLYAARAATPPPPKPSWFDKAVGAFIGGAKVAGTALLFGPVAAFQTAKRERSAMKDAAQAAADAAASFEAPNIQAPDFDKAECSQCGGKPPRIGQGSETVFINGQPASRSGDQVECGATIDTGSNNVYIAGPQGTTLEIDDEIPLWGEVVGFVLGCLNPIGLLRGAFKLGVKGIARGLATGIKSAFKASKGIINKAAKAIAEALDPVDPVTGSVIDCRVDFSLPGPIPLQLMRSYKSNIVQFGLAGHGWMDNWSEFIKVDGDDLRYTRFDGSSVYYRKPTIANPVAINLDAPHLMLTIEDGIYTIENKKEKLLYHFSIFANHEAYLTKITDYHENFVNVGRNKNGALAYIQDSAGTHIEVAKQNNALHFDLIGETHSPRQLVKYTLNERKQLTEVEGLEEGYFRYGYDDENRMLWWGDANHILYNFRYDHEGRVVGGEGIRGFYIGKIEYDTKAQQTAVFDSYGKTIYKYNEHNEITDIIDASGQITRYIFDEENQLITEIDTIGRETHFEYDENGNTNKITYPDGNSQQFEFDDEFNLIKETGIDGSCVEYIVGDKGQVQEIALPNNQHAKFEYTKEGFAQKLFIGDVLLGEYDYTARGLSLSETNAARHKSQYLYDCLGQVTHITDPIGATTQMGYTQKGSGRSLLCSVKMPDGENINYQYDEEGLLIAVKDGEGRTTRNEYGPFDILEKTIFPGGETLSYEYDRETRLLAVINSAGEKYSYGYDSLGRVIRETDFAGRTTHYKRDAVGNCTAKKAPNNTFTHYTYDIMDRLIALEVYDNQEKFEKDEQPNVFINYTYDKFGQLTQVQNAHSLIEFEYDEQGRIVAEIQNGQKIAFTYDSSGRLDTRLLPSGLASQYAWDAMGELSEIHVGGAVPLKIDRDALGRDLVRRSTSGFTEARQYTRGGKLHEQWVGSYTGASDTLKQAIMQPHVHGASRRTHREYKWNKAFNPIEVVDAHWGRKSFTYNANAQISQVQHGGIRAGNRQATLSESFQYDSRFNIAEQHSLIESWSDGQSLPQENKGGSRTYAKGGLIQDFIIGAGHRVHYEYDAAGRVISKTDHRNGFRPKTTHLKWNGLDQLVEVQTPYGENIHYRYDPFGRRIAKAVSGAKIATAQTAYLWDGTNLAQEQCVINGTTGEAVAWHFMAGSVEPVARQTSAGVHYVVTDHLGTPKEMFSEDGELAWKADHALWGRLDQTAQLAANDNVACPIRFPGQYADDETGFHYNFYRYYDPDTGQYLSPDPIGLAGGHRSSGYVLNPSSTIDSLGLKGCSAYMKGFGRGEKGFKNFWDNATDDAFEAAWKNPKQRTNIMERLRGNGGMHEWLPVSQADKFRKMGIGYDDFMKLRSPTKNLRFIDTAAGSGRHAPYHWAGDGFGTGKNWGNSAASHEVHEMLFDSAASARNFNEYASSVRDIANQHLPFGIFDLPLGLR